MKTTSLQKLSEVYNYLTVGLDEGEDLRIAGLIKEVIRAESPDVKAGKFNIFDFVSKDEIRPQMNCVYHNEGFKVASDSHILVVVKDAYPEEYEHKLLRKDGGFEEGEYPKYKQIKQDMKDVEPTKIDAEKFYAWLKVRRAEFKAETGTSRKWNYSWYVKVGPAYLRAELFDKLLKAMDRLGTDELFVKDSHRAVQAESEDGWVVLMPVIEPTDAKVLEL